jgi:hypothetical protein
MQSTQTSGNGLGFGTVLFLVFLVLKLTGVIAWSWLWVTAPLWIPFAIFAAFLVLVFVLAVVAGAKPKVRRR